MAITSLDQVIAGTVPPIDCMKIGGTMEAGGVLHDLGIASGYPAAQTWSAALNGSALTSLSGQVPFTNPASGNTYLSRLVASASQPGTLLLIDKLWHNGGYTATTTTAENTTHPGLPARDRAGSTNGDGVMLALEVEAATGNGSAITNTTCSYTNQAGTASRTGTIASFPATAVAGTFVPFMLAAGDTGVRSVQSLTKGTSYVSGTIHLVQYRILAAIPCLTPNVASEINAITGGFPRLFDNTTPFALWMPTSTTATNASFQVSYAQG